MIQQSAATMSKPAERLAELDHAHLWHPFTPMRRWRSSRPLIIDRAEGFELIDTEGRRYIDGVSSLWCNVHGHRVPQIDQAICRQLAKVAHTTLLGLGSPPSIELAARLLSLAPGRLNKVFFSDAGSTAVEVALKMAIGYWHHRGMPEKTRFIGLKAAYHGDTTGAMSVGYSEPFHAPFGSMLFPVDFAPAPDPCHGPEAALGPVARGLWPSEDPDRCTAGRSASLAALERLLKRDGARTAAIVIEPLVQAAAGMICQPPGFARAVGELAERYQALLIVDEVATGFGRTGTLFASHQEHLEPDIMCLAKGLSGGYLPLAATLVTDRIEEVFAGSADQPRVFYHGHTYTGNALGCAAALASLDLFWSSNLLEHVKASARLIRDRLNGLRACHHVLDIRQRGLMVGIELCRDRTSRQRLDPSHRRTGEAVCAAMRTQGLILRPLGDVVVLMPPPAMGHDLIERMLGIVIRTIKGWQWD